MEWRKVLKNIGVMLLAIVMLIAGGSFWVGEMGLAHPALPRYQVGVSGNTSVRHTVTGANIGDGIRQGATFAVFPGHNLEQFQGWTWHRGAVNGDRTQLNGVPAGTYWVSTSQLSPLDNLGTASCNVASNTTVRHTPGGVNQGITGGTGVSFHPIGAARAAGGWTWTLGFIIGTNNATNTWRNRLVWVTTSQLTPRNSTIPNSICRPNAGHW